MNFILTIFKTIVGGLCKFIFNIFDSLPSIPDVVVALDTFDLITMVSAAQNFFLPVDTISNIVGGIVGFYALKLLLSLLRSDWFKHLLSSVVGKFNGLLGLIMKFIK